jgi:hypothetical protein
MAKTTPSVQSTERSKALDTLTSITEQAIAFRFQDRVPTLSDVARVVSTASRLLRFSNLDERIETENACVMQLARRRQLVS